MPTSLADGCARHLLGLCLASTLLLGFPCDGLAASDAFPFMRQQTDFSIPPQSLSGALMSLGRQADLQILSAGDTVDGRYSAGTSGTLNVQAALSRVLEGTGLGYKVIGNRTVVIRQSDVTPEKPLRQPIQRALVVSTFDTVHVSGIALAQAGFKADTTRAATRTDAQLADIPQSVSIVTRDLMDSMQAFEVSDVVRHVVGVDYVDGLGGPPLFRIRGFSSGNGLTDGMPNGVSRIEDMPPLIGIQQVEVLKGPETILGESSLDNNFGGSVNIVMKRPQAAPVRQLVFSTGRYDGTRLGVDLAGALDQGGQFTYRLVAAGNRAGRTEQGYRGERRSYLAPSIAWQGDATQLLFGLEYVDNQVPVPDHKVLLGPSLADSSSFQQLLGNPDDHARFRTRRAYYAIEQALGDQWSLHSRGQYVSQKTSGQAWSFVDTQQVGLANAYASAYRYSDAFYTLQNDLSASFDQGMLVHNVLLGFDYARTHTGSGSDSDERANVFTTSMRVDTVSHEGPLPSVASQDLSIGRVRPLGGSWSTNTGLFVQDQLAIGELWNVLATIRHASYEVANGAAPSQRRSKWVPRLGVVYKVAPDVSVYASSDTGFQVNALLGQDGRPLPPSVSRQLELGSRLALFGQRARLSVAWYRIRLDHSVSEISPEPPYFAVPGPGQTNTGVELEFEGQIRPGLNVSASYTNARVRNHDGSLPYGAPRHQSNAWVSYRFQQGALQSWGVAGGVFARSRTRGSIDGGGYFNIPGQVSAEANVSYEAGRWGATLGVKNLFAHTLYAINAQSSFVPVREGRVVTLSGTYSF